MEHWELEAREAIRDLVARYNANGDSGRFAQVIELFAPDAVMDVGWDRVFTGPDEILTIFTGTREKVVSSDKPMYMRHYTATHQIDVTSPTEANGRCYYHVLTPHGLDHWGRYIDEYRTVDGVWRFARRKVTTDGRAGDAYF